MCQHENGMFLKTYDRCKTALMNLCMYNKMPLTQTRAHFIFQIYNQEKRTVK